MSTEVQPTISRLSPRMADQVSGLISRVVLSLSYYNQRAKAEEVAKYTADGLVNIVRDDPDAVLVAVVDHRPVGFCISRYDDGLIWLAWFGVDPDFRTRGIGRRLLEALAMTISDRRAHKIWCDTRTANRLSQSVLQHFGFKKVAQLTNHWYGQDFFLWEWLPCEQE